MSRTVFISHSHEDNDMCVPIVQALQSWGIDYWFDNSRLTGGDQIDRDIEVAIQQRDIFLRICTPAATRSEYMRRELAFFTNLQDAERKESGTRRKLIPLVMSESYQRLVLESAVKFISTWDRPRAEWLNDLREAIGGQTIVVPGYPPNPDSVESSLPSREGIPQSPKVRQMLQEMDKAIAAELEKVARSSQGHAAIDGQFVGNADGQYLYSFTLPELWEAQDDIPIIIKWSGQQKGIEAYVVTSTGNNITIAASRQLPESALRKVMLSDDPRRLLEKMREALGEGSESAAHLGSKTFKLERATVPMGPYRPLPEVSPKFTPNSSQATAIQKALANEVSYIIGPPGTGKTATLAAIARPFIQNGASVLIAAHTNIAVDNAILKVAEQAEGFSALGEGHIVRCGPAQLDAVKRHKEIYPPNIAKRIGQELDGQKVVIEASRKQIISQLASLQETQEAQARKWSDEHARLLQSSAVWQNELVPLQQRENARVVTLQAQLAQAKHDLAGAASQVNAAEHTRAQLVARQSQLQVDLERSQVDEAATSRRLVEAQKMSGLARFVRRVSIDTLVKQVGELKQSVWQCERCQEIGRSMLRNRPPRDDHVIVAGMSVCGA